MDPNTKKAVLRMVPYGLYVVTSATASDRSAFLCNWLTQCSFEPPLVVVAVENDAHSLKVMRTSGRFAVNVLESGQKELAGWFGRHSEKVGDKLANRELLATPSGLPLLPEALAWFECVVGGEMPAGDHVLLVAEVIDADLRREGTPLPLKETGFRYAG
jgi:flavin reductase (DIM6/NTAB) family NADH-FMN oxidoreductase RutF